VMKSWRLVHLGMFVFGVVTIGLSVYWREYPLVISGLCCCGFGLSGLYIDRLKSECDE